MNKTSAVVRTIVQVLLAVAVAIPAAVALLPVSAAVSAGVVGVAGALVVVVTAVQNALEAKGAIPTLTVKSKPTAVQADAADEPVPNLYENYTPVAATPAAWDPVTPDGEVVS